MLIRKSFDTLQLNQQRPTGHQIRYILTQPLAFIEDRIPNLRLHRHPAQPQLPHQRPFI
jgi:hypothetical protein